LILHNVCRASGVLVIVLFLLVVGVLLVQGWPAITALGVRFLASSHWNPVTHNFGALPFVFGTLATSALAMLIAVPLGVSTAAFLSEIAPPWLRRGGAFLVEMLAAIPSVVYGTWGLLVLAPAMAKFYLWIGGPETTGKGIFTAGLILAVMILPYVTAISFDVCQAVPRTQREGSLALGATRWQTIWSVVLPYASSGIMGASFLALGRALGETMAVTMLIGNTSEISFSLFAKGDSIASCIATQLNGADDSFWRSTLIELGLVLVLVTIVVNSLARLLIIHVGRGKKGPLPWRHWLGQRSPPTAPEPHANSAPRSAGAPPRQNPRAILVDRVMTGVLAGSLLVAVGPLFLIFGYLVYQGFEYVNLDFFTQLPVDEPRGMANALVGSAMLVGLATLGAVPLGVLAGLYLVEYRSRRLAPAVRFVGELLNGVPSIIIGTVAYALRVLPVHRFSGWAGSFALGVMMIPIVMRGSEESLKLVPVAIRNASYALGASQWQTILRVILPAARPAIITAVFLAVARIAGETAPLLVTAFGNQFWARSPSDPTPSLPVYIYNYSKDVDVNLNHQAWVAALVLLTVVMMLSAGIRMLTGKRIVLASRAE
jgi:phosphate transport system permease protein